MERNVGRNLIVFIRSPYCSIRASRVRVCVGILMVPRSSEIEASQIADRVEMLAASLGHDGILAAPEVHAARN